MDEPWEDLVKVTDVPTCAWTVVRRQDVMAALRIWVPLAAPGQEQALLARIAELQRLIDAGEDTEALEIELRISIEDFDGPDEDLGRTGG